MKAYVKQKELPYRGEPTKQQRVNLYHPDQTWATLHEQDMGKPRDRKKKKNEEGGNG